MKTEIKNKIESLINSFRLEGKAPRQVEFDKGAFCFGIRDAYVWESDTWADDEDDDYKQLTDASRDKVKRYASAHFDAELKKIGYKLMWAESEKCWVDFSITASK